MAGARSQVGRRHGHPHAGYAQEPVELSPALDPKDWLRVPGHEACGEFFAFQRLHGRLDRGFPDSHEARSLPKLAAGYAKGEVVVADRGFCSYANIASLSGIGCDSVFRLHQARKVDLRKGKALGPMDRIVEWKRPQRPRGFSAEQWSLVPSKLTLRVLRFRPAVAGFRSREIVLVTTLTDARAYPKSELQNLYMKRWAVELRFRELKTTMGMETLRCKSPKMMRKELRMHVIAFNLVRAMMLESLSMTFARIERISFKAAVASLRLFRAELPASASAKRIREVRKELIAAIAASTVPDRPGRSEPRAVKTRPKGYQLLTFPRRMMKISKSRKAS